VVDPITELSQSSDLSARSAFNQCYPVTETASLQARVVDPITELSQSSDLSARSAFNQCYAPWGGDAEHRQLNVGFLAMSSVQKTLGNCAGRAVRVLHGYPPGTDTVQCSTDLDSTAFMRLWTVVYQHAMPALSQASDTWQQKDAKQLRADLSYLCQGIIKDIKYGHLAQTHLEELVGVSTIFSDTTRTGQATAL